jgi:hypothetical protein
MHTISLYLVLHVFTATLIRCELNFNIHDQPKMARRCSLLVQVCVNGDVRSLDGLSGTDWQGCSRNRFFREKTEDSELLLPSKRSRSFGGAPYEEACRISL